MGFARDGNHRGGLSVRRLAETPHWPPSFPRTRLMARGAIRKVEGKVGTLAEN
jgi:hypothetical protein